MSATKRNVYNRGDNSGNLVSALEWFACAILGAILVLPFVFAPEFCAVCEWVGRL